MSQHSTRTTQRDDARCVDEDYSISLGCWQLKRTFVLRILCRKWYLFFPIILNVLFLLKLWSFTQFLFGCFVLPINPLFWVLKFHFIFIYMIIICISLPPGCITIKPLPPLAVNFHFPPWQFLHHQNNFYWTGIDRLTSALTRWISL